MNTDFRVKHSFWIIGILSLVLVLWLPGKAKGDALAFEQYQNPYLNIKDCNADPTVRILLYSGSSSVCVSAKFGLFINDNPVSEDENGNYSLNLVPDPLNKGGECTIKGTLDELIGVNGKYYRGIFEIYDDGAQLEVVNVVPLEEYLRGVVPEEILSSKIEAVKAQAVVARTYALAHRKDPQKCRWDMRDDSRSQVYGGANSEDPISDTAIKETEGLVLVYKGKLAGQALYHSTCGGQTEGNAEVFGTSPISYLQSVSCADSEGNPYCISSSYASWKAEIDPEKLGQELERTLGKTKGPIERLEIVETAPGGRAVRVCAYDSSGQSAEFSLDQVRKYLRYNNTSGRLTSLPSARFVVEKCDKEAILLQGSGWGHGVGMCQWGAMGMAKAGFTFVDILQHYYPGTEVKPRSELDI